MNCNEMLSSEKEALKLSLEQCRQFAWSGISNTVNTLLTIVLAIQSSKKIMIMIMIKW